MYWESPVLVAGETKGVVVQERDATWRVWVTGTQSESLLREVGGRCRELRIHICPEPCDKLVWSKDLIHGLRYRVQEGAAEDWWSNLEEVPRDRDRADPGGGDPLRRVREEMDEREREGELRYSLEAAAPPVWTRGGSRREGWKKEKTQEVAREGSVGSPPQGRLQAHSLGPRPRSSPGPHEACQKDQEGKEKKKKRGSRSRSRGSNLCSWELAPCSRASGPLDIDACKEMCPHWNGFCIWVLV